MMIRIEDILRLMTVPSVGQQRIRHLISAFPDSAQIFSASVQHLCRIEGISKETALKIKQESDSEFPRLQIEKADQENRRFVHFWDPDYPEILKKIHDPPVLLFVQGQWPVPFQPGLAVVGTRTPSDYGRSVTRDICQAVSMQGIPIISGFARGIDTVAHQSVLKSDGVTFGVLGCGLDVCYPPENRKMKPKMLERGALISEFPFGTEPLAPHFPRRNRMISGLSYGTLVVEAGARSGALITAYLALEQGREVFAVPGSVKNKMSHGPHRLIREGAKLVEHAEDIFNEVPAWQTFDSKMVPVEKDIKTLSADEKKVYAVIQQEPLHIDKISGQLEMSISETLTVLLQLEIKEYVRQLSGMNFVRH